MERFKKGVMILVFMLCLVNAAGAQPFEFVPGVGGFLSKEVVQVALNWDSETWQANAAQLHFIYETIDGYQVVCATSDQVDPKHRQVIIKKIGSVKSQLAEKKGKDGQTYLLGIELLGIEGFDSVNVSVPSAGERCEAGEGRQGVVEQVVLTNVLDRLYADFGGRKVHLWTESY